MFVNKIVLFIACLLVMTTLPGLCGAQARAGQCFINAWIEDPELPKIDSSIRSAPSWKGRSLLEIPFAGDDDEPVAVEIVGFSNDYLKIRKASTSHHKVDFNGIGWLLARRVSVFVDSKDQKASTLYAAPKASARRVGKVPHGTLLNYAIEGFNCFGLRVTYEGKTGWLAAGEICGNGPECHKKFDYKKQ